MTGSPWNFQVTELSTLQLSAIHELQFMFSTPPLVPMVVSDCEFSSGKVRILGTAVWPVSSFSVDQEELLILFTCC